MTSLPLDFPPLREMATDASARWIGAFLDEIRADPAAYRSVHARLLSDLTRPESQAVWLRWLAGRVGVPVPDVGAPCWYLVPKRPARELRTVDGEYLDHDDGAPAMWVLSGDGQEHTFAWWDPDDGPPPAPGDGVDVWLPSWPDTPIWALVLAVLTVGGAP